MRTTTGAASNRTQSLSAHMSMCGCWNVVTELGLGGASGVLRHPADSARLERAAIL